jgi:transposase
MPSVSIEAMNKHLVEISNKVALGAHAALIVDGAGWHRPGGALKIPDNITLIPLPPYCPELNPIENVWAYLRGNKLSITVWETYEAIVDACCKAWNFFINDPDRVTSVTRQKWATVNI